MDKLPNDIIISICKQNRINKQNDLYKKRHGLFIKYLDYYLDEHGESAASNMYVGKDMRTDCQFLEYENLWNTTFEKSINKKWGADNIDRFMDDSF
tara:strand:- start:260 stop:547 length:288 start_codon:yes stop_codon:yes gene_type:complete